MMTLELKVLILEHVLSKMYIGDNEPEQADESIESTLNLTTGLHLEHKYLWNIDVHFYTCVLELINF